MDDPGFAERLRACIGEEPVASFARRCGFSEGLIRSYLKEGKQPGMTNLMLIAKAAGVTMDWLATGRGDKHPRADVKVAEESSHYGDKYGRKWRQIIDLVNGIPDEGAREAFLQEVFARAQEKAEIAELYRAVRELRAAARTSD